MVCAGPLAEAAFCSDSTTGQILLAGATYHLVMSRASRRRHRRDARYSYLAVLCDSCARDDVVALRGTGDGLSVHSVPAHAHRPRLVRLDTFAAVFAEQIGAKS